MVFNAFALVAGLGPQATVHRLQQPLADAAQGERVVLLQKIAGVFDGRSWCCLLVIKVVV